MPVIINSVTTENNQYLTVSFTNTNTNTVAYNYSTDGKNFTPYNGPVIPLQNNNYLITISGLYLPIDYFFILQAMNGSTIETSNVYPFRTSPTNINITNGVLSGGNFSIILYFNINDPNTNKYSFEYSYDGGNTYYSVSQSQYNYYDNSGTIQITSGNMQPETELLFIVKAMHNVTLTQTYSNTYNYYLPFKSLDIFGINTNGTSITAILNNYNNPTFNDYYQYSYSLDGGNIFTSFPFNNGELIIPNIHTEILYSLVLNIAYNNISKNTGIVPIQLLPVPTFEISSVTSNGATIIFNNYINGFMVDFLHLFSFQTLIIYRYFL